MNFYEDMSYHTLFEDPELSGASGATTPQIRTPAMLVLMIVGKYKIQR